MINVNYQKEKTHKIKNILYTVPLDILQRSETHMTTDRQKPSIFGRHTKEKSKEKSKEKIKFPTLLFEEN